jgi:hydrogenase maturation protease
VRVKTLILGMGNPILTDDGVGLIIAPKLAERIGDIDVETSPIIGLGLLDQVSGYDRIYVIDAMCTKDGNLGEVSKIREDGKEGTLHLFSSHGVHFFELMKLGKDCGMPMPEIGAVYGIEIGSCVAFGEGLSDQLLEKVDSICGAIITDMIDSGIGVGLRKCEELTSFQ